MLNHSPPKKDAKPSTSKPYTDEPAQDLRFISDLGRSLLLTVHPKKVASRVADAIRQGLDAEICVFAAELKNIGLITCAADRNGGVATNFLDRSRLDKWLNFMPPLIGHSETDRDEFMITGPGHDLEYVSPLHIDGEIRGAILTGFASVSDLDDNKARLIDAATQMAAMSINLSAHYETALNNSIHEAREEHRKFTEAVLDALAGFALRRRPRIPHRHMESSSRDWRAGNTA